MDNGPRLIPAERHLAQCVFKADTTVAPNSLKEICGNMIFGAGITQLVECKLPKLDVAGSNPVARSNLLIRTICT